MVSVADNLNRRDCIRHDYQYPVGVHTKPQQWYKCNRLSQQWSPSPQFEINESIEQYATYWVHVMLEPI